MGKWLKRNDAIFSVARAKIFDCSRQREVNQELREQMSNENKVAVFGGGCFWCTEAVFDELRGVHSVVSGYAGGKVKNPTYEQVCMGNTGHAEVIKIEFDPAQVSFRDLMTVFFATHDPTTLNRQGNDVGTQYRSAIFYADEQQKQDAAAFIKELDEAKTFKNSIVTTLEPLTEFYAAEDYHQKFYANNPGQGYCQYMIPPKLNKLHKQFAELLKSHGK
jgi:peptide-methionine (S)-S-oxide reductase